MAKRKGQQTFRRRSVRAHRQNNMACEATLSTLSFATDACHVKPYAVCNEEEQMDPNNSILLLSSIHRAFDHGLISFDETGHIIISKEIDDWEIKCLGLSGQEKIRMPAKRPEYMEYHRKNIFKDGDDTDDQVFRK